ncbi:hypothetical protein NDU88_011093 [Pleurodeles waltl]|uniref:Uncharacterized protein n=1 Tax=Pleurodeles waltl TaxID=8319 RepID=A0AAV7S5Z4_PLEWA|nr:hypothetical protein NDU88_011093 [Pleurodeles waltl]
MAAASPGRAPELWTEPQSGGDGPSGRPAIGGVGRGVLWPGVSRCRNRSLGRTRGTGECRGLTRRPGREVTLCCWRVGRWLWPVVVPSPFGLAAAQEAAGPRGLRVDSEARDG